MRRFAISVGVFVILVVGALNIIDAKFPNALGRLQPGNVVPDAATQSTPAPSQGTPSQPSVAVSGRPSRAPLEEVGTLGLYPGAHVERIVYGARPYVDMTVVSVSNQTVVLRNDREIVSIPTGSLPDDLRQMAIAYLDGSDASPSARAGSPAFPISELPSAPPPTTVTPPVATAGDAADQDSKPDFETLAWQAARERAERWLRFERKRRATDIVPLVTGVDLKTPLPMSGLPGYWKVRGRGYVATYQSEKGGTFHDFEVTIVLNAQGELVRADIDIL